MLKSSNKQASARQLGSTRSPPTTKFIQRLLIFYPELPKLCEGNIDESSSEEELTEHILYFHDEDSPNFGTDSPHYATEEAIRFLGLCSALYVFPSSLEGAGNDDRSREVVFGNSTLVFCSLEKDELLAVIQVSSGEPLAIRSSFLRSHSIYCLLQGGGIVPHLLSKDHVPNLEVPTLEKPDMTVSFEKSSSLRDMNDDMPPDISDILEFELDQHRSHQDIMSIDDISIPHEDDGCVYAGMKSLYRLRKQVHKKKVAISRVSVLLKLKRQIMQDELEETIKTLHELYEVLPIAALRRKLKAHYDEYLAEASLSNRCLVETIPLPIRPDISIPATPSAAASIQLGHSVRALLRYEFQSNDMDAPPLVAISSFYKGSILYTHTLQDLNTDASIGIGISSQTACQIMRYMTYFEQRMQNQPNNRLRMRMRMRRAASLQNIRQTLEESLQQLSLTSNYSKKQPTLEEEEMVMFGHYLSSPPLSMLNISDELSEINDSTLGNIWIPKFHVLVDGQYLSVQAALYSLNDFSFLVFFHDAGELLDMSPEAMQLSSTSFYDNYFSDSPLHEGPASKDDDDDDGDAEKQTPTAKRLVDVSLHLSVCVNDLSPLLVDGPPIFEREKGLDIVFVDRLRQDVVVLPSTKQDRKGPKALGRAMRKNRDDGILATDLRHQLLSKFSPEVSDAFDDLMNEVHQAAAKAKGDVELCTYLSDGWVWAASSGAKELYVLFDPTIHSTVTDVQQNAERLRQRFFCQR